MLASSFLLTRIVRSQKYGMQPFLNLKKCVSPSRVIKYSCLVNLDACEAFSGYLTFHKISRRLFMGIRRFAWSDIWYFHVEAIVFCCVISFDFIFDFIKFNIHCFFKFCFWCLNISAYFVSVERFLGAFNIGIVMGEFFFLLI